ncbi:MAG: transporter, ATPase subunit [Acidobacteriales bacterium]|nr:transporter, ATPase subunit [Terriglobales bacterium]
MGHASLLYDELTGMENLRYFAELQGMGTSHETIKKCELAMNCVGLDPGMHRNVHAYSQGMRQRLSLARAVLHSPKIVLLDEPFSNVDAVSMAQMSRHLGELRDAGCTVIVITHQVTALAHTGDEFLTMQLGRIIESRKRAQLRPTEVGL